MVDGIFILGIRATASNPAQALKGGGVRGMDSGGICEDDPQVLLEISFSIMKLPRLTCIPSLRVQT